MPREPLNGLERARLLGATEAQHTIAADHARRALRLVAVAAAHRVAAGDAAAAAAEKALRCADQANRTFAFCCDARRAYDEGRDDFEVLCQSAVESCASAHDLMVDVIRWSAGLTEGASDAA